MSLPTEPDRTSARPGWFSLSRTHTAKSAAMLLILSSLSSALLGLVRLKYLLALFGAGWEQDAYRAAFKLPDLLSYFLVGAAASVSVVTMLNRYREQGDDEGADRALSVVTTTMFTALAAVMVLAAIFAPVFVHAAYSFHDPRTIALCISLTRWLLPAQLFFFLGSMMSARLQVRKIFIYQALSPVVYNAGIILGAFFLHKQLGVYSPVVGVLAGVILGSALLNTLGALRTGLQFRPRLSFTDPAFREYITTAAPLMLGVSLVMFDGIFFNKFASDQVGQLTNINTAKDLFNSGFNIIGPAVGAASLPFFTSLYQRNLHAEFSASVARSASKLFAIGLLVSAWMLAFAPWIMDLLRGGRFHHNDAVETTYLFRIFVVTLALWAVQGIYARAFYAASDTLTVAIAGSVVVVLSFPFYWLLHRTIGMPGLALASDLGILAQTATLAILLHKRRLVSLAELEYAELGKAITAAVVSYLGTHLLLDHLPAMFQPGSHLHDLLTLFAVGLVWTALAMGVLIALRSNLPKQLLRRKT